MFAPIFLILTSALTIALDNMQRGPAKPGADARTSETAQLKLTTSTGPQPAGAAEKLVLFLDIAPKPKMHVFAPGQEGYIAVALTLDGSSAFTSSPPQFPKAEKVFFKALNETQLVYSKPFRIVQEITFARGERAAPTTDAPLTIKGSLRYQACDDKVCYLPKTVPIEWTVQRKR